MISTIMEGPGISTFGSSHGNYNSKTGVVRWNGSYQQLEVMDDNNWNQIPVEATRIGLSPDVLAVVSWAQGKMTEEAKLKALCDQHQGLKDLKERFDVMLALVQNHQEGNDK